MTSKKNPIVGTYETTVSVPPPINTTDLQMEINKAWCFRDGHCNRRDRDGTIVAKPGGEDPGLMEVHRKLLKHSEVTLVVTNYKDGSKKFKIKEPKS
jgi:hypothetical protein